MASITELYKMHINPDADGAEIHRIYNLFDIGIHVNYPACEPWLGIHYEREKAREAKVNMCKKWILENSKTLKDGKV